MTQDDDTPEDIAGLFRKFGGDAHGYKEFAPPEAEGEAPKAWPLLSGEKIVRAPVAAPTPVARPAQPVAAVPPAKVEPVLRPPAPLASALPPPAPAPVFAPAPAPAFVQPAPPPAADTSHHTPTPLEQLFARLAAPQPPAAAPGPMSRWRRPT